jgi:hypothetical protein
MADDDVLDRIGAEAFARPKLVDDLQRESFTIHELGVAFAGKILPSMIREIVSRHKIPLVAAMPGGAAEPRRYHLIDAYMIAAFAVFNRELDPATPKAHRPAALAKLRTALHHFLWGGDPMTPAAAEERRAEFKAARTTALKRGGWSAKENDLFIFKLHEQRRHELGADIFSAPAHVWARDADKHFIAFMRKDVTLSCTLVDFGGPNGTKIDIGPLVKLGFQCMIDVTRLFAEVDSRVAEVVKARGAGPELCEAD